jgi:hypothetical protein
VVLVIQAAASGKGTPTKLHMCSKRPGKYRVQQGASVDARRECFGDTHVRTVQSSLARPLSAAAFKAHSSAWSTQIVMRSASVGRRPWSLAALTNALRSFPSASTRS